MLCLAHLQTLGTAYPLLLQDQECIVRFWQIVAQPRRVCVKAVHLFGSLHEKWNIFLLQHMAEQTPKEVLAWVAFDPVPLNPVDEQDKRRGEIDPPRKLNVIGHRVGDIDPAQGGGLAFARLGINWRYFRIPAGAPHASWLFRHDQHSLGPCDKGGDQNHKKDSQAHTHSIIIM